MSQLLSIIESDDFKDASPLERTQVLPALFEVAIKEKPEAFDAYRNLDPEGRKGVFNKFQKDLFQRFPDQYPVDKWAGLRLDSAVLQADERIRKSEDLSEEQKQARLDSLYSGFKAGKEIDPTDNLKRFSENFSQEFYEGGAGGFWAKMLKGELTPQRTEDLNKEIFDSILSRANKERERRDKGGEIEKFGVVEQMSTFAGDIGRLVRGEDEKFQSEKIKSYSDEELDALIRETEQAKKTYFGSKDEAAEGALYRLGQYEGLPEAEGLGQNTVAFFGALGGGIAQPENLIPFGGGVARGAKGVSKLKSRLSKSIQEGIGAGTISETARQSGQILGESREDADILEGVQNVALETLVNVGLSEVGNVLGSGIKKLSSNIGEQDTDILKDLINKELNDAASYSPIRKAKGQQTEIKRELVSLGEGEGVNTNIRSTVDQEIKPETYDVGDTHPSPYRQTEFTDAKIDAESNRSSIGGKESKTRFTEKTIQESPNAQQELKDLAGSYYTRITNQDTLNAAQARIDENGLDAEFVKFRNIDEPSAEDYAVGIDMIRRYQNEGNFDAAADIANEIGKKSTKQGQAIQSLAMFNRLTPEGALVYARRLAAKAQKEGKNVPDFTKKEIDELNKLQKQFDESSDGFDKLLAGARRLEIIHSKIPESVGAKLRSIANFSMLLNPKTLARNLGGNIILFTTENVADKISPIVDVGVSVFTGKRTRTMGFKDIPNEFSAIGQPIADISKAFNRSKEAGKDNWAALKDGVESLRVLSKLTSSGKFDIQDVDKSFKQIFPKKGLQKYLNWLEGALTIGLGSTDRAFHQSAFRRSLNNQIRIAQKAGAEPIAPTQEMITQAMMDANRAIFLDENFASSGLNKIRKGLNWTSTIGRSNDIGLGQAIIPFTQVPGSLMVRSFDWSPLGFIRSMYETSALLSNTRDFDQRAFVDSFTRASLGSGVAALGAWLYNLGVLSASDEEDADIRALQRNVGLGKYRVNTSALKRVMLTGDWDTPQGLEDGDVLVNYDWVQPNAFSIALGAEIMKQQDEGKFDVKKGKTNKDFLETILASSGAIKGSIKTLEDQPLLSGVKRFMEDLSYNGMTYGSLKQYGNLIGQYSPTALSQIKQYIDNRSQETRSSNAVEEYLNRFESRLPIVAKESGFTPRYETLGDAAERYQAGTNSFFNVFLNPAFVSKYEKDPVIEEVLRLFSETGETSQAPRIVPREVTIGGERIGLNSQQISDYQRLVGATTSGYYNQIIQSPEYLELSDEQKVEELRKWLTDINKAAKIALFNDSEKGASRRARDIASYIQ